MPYGGTINTTVNADLVQTDVDGIIQGLSGPSGMTLSDVHERLNYGLCDPYGYYPYLQMLQMDMNHYLYNQWASMPWLQMIDTDLNYYLYNWQWGNEPWLQTVERSITTGFYSNLYDQSAYQPWLQTIHNDLFSPMSLMPWLEMTNYDLRYYLYCSWASQTWMEMLYYAVDGGFHYMLYDQNAMQPWLQTLNYTIQSYLYDWMNNRPWMESIRDELSALRAVLEDVHDAAQHALRTV